jgi:hypothetical protein
MHVHYSLLLAIPDLVGIIEKLPLGLAQGFGTHLLDKLPLGLAQAFGRHLLRHSASIPSYTISILSQHHHHLADSHNHQLDALHKSSTQSYIVPVRLKTGLLGLEEGHGEPANCPACSRRSRCK